MALGDATVGEKNQYRYSPSHDKILSAIISVITKVNSGQVSGYELGIYEKLQELKTRDKGVANLLDLDLDTLTEAQIITTLTEGISEYVFGEMSKVLLWDEDGTLQGLDLSENYWTKEQTLNEINKAIREGTNQSDWMQTNPSASTFIKNKPQNLSDFTNDKHYISLADVADRPTATEVDAKIVDKTKDLVTTEDLQNAIDQIDVSKDFGFATKDYVDEAIKNAEVNTDIIATKEFIEQQGFLTNDDLNGYATEAYVTQRIAEVATGGEISLDGYATESEMNQGFQSIQAQLTQYATQESVNNKVTELEEKILTEEQIAEDFVSKADYHKNIHIIPYVPSAQLLYQYGYEALLPYEGNFVQIESETPIEDRMGKSDITFTNLVYVGKEFTPTVNALVTERETDAANQTTHTVYKIGTFQEKTPYYFYKTNAGGTLVSIGLESVEERSDSKIATYKFVKPNGSYASLHKSYSLSDEVRSNILLTQTEEDINGIDIEWTQLEPLNTEGDGSTGLKVFSFTNNTEYLLHIIQVSASEYQVEIYSETPKVQIPNLDGYATQDSVTNAIAAATNGMATEAYVQEAIANLPKEEPDLTGYATETYVIEKTEEIKRLINNSGSSITTIDYNNISDFCEQIIANEDQIVHIINCLDDSLNGLISISRPITTSTYNRDVESSDMIRVIFDYVEGAALASEIKQKSTVTYDYFTDTEIIRRNSTEGVFKFDLPTNTFISINEMSPQTISFNFKADKSPSDLNAIFLETPYIKASALMLVLNEIAESYQDEPGEAPVTDNLLDENVKGYELFNYNQLTTNKVKITKFSQPEVQYCYEITKTYPLVTEGSGTASIDTEQLNQALSAYATKDFVIQKVNEAQLSGGESGPGIDLSIYATKEEVPNLVTVPTSVSQLTNDAGYISSLPENVLTEDNVTGKLVELGYVTGTDVDGKIQALNIPNSTSQLTNDSEFVTSSYVQEYVQREIVNVTTGGTINLDSYATISYVDSKIPDLANYITKDGLIETLKNGTEISDLADLGSGYVLCQMGNKIYKLDPAALASAGEGGSSGGSVTTITFETQPIDFSNFTFS